MPHRAQPLPPEIAAVPFTSRHARALGVTRSKLARIPAPWHGVRVAHPASDLIGRCLELLPALPPGAAFSHATAWQLWDLDLPHGLPVDTLHVLVPAELTAIRRPGVTGHRACAHPEVADRYHLPVCALSTTWTQLATELSVDELVVAGDAALRRQTPRSSRQALEREVTALAPGTRGVRRLREALALVRPGTDSCMETRLRLLLCRLGLPCPVVNQPVLATDGRIVARPDLSYPDLRIAIEYDGDIHRTDRATWQRDIARRRALESLGWRIITCTAADLRNPTPLLISIHRARAEAARMHAS